MASSGGGSNGGSGTSSGGSNGGSITSSTPGQASASATIASSVRPSSTASATPGSSPGSSPSQLICTIAGPFPSPNASACGGEDCRVDYELGAFVQWAPATKSLPPLITEAVFVNPSARATCHTTICNTDTFNSCYSQSQTSCDIPPCPSNSIDCDCNIVVGPIHLPDGRVTSVTQTGPGGYKLILGPTAFASNVATQSCGTTGCLSRQSTTLFTDLVYYGAVNSSTSYNANGALATNYLLQDLSSYFPAGNPLASCTTVSLVPYKQNAIPAGEQPLRKRQDDGAGSSSFTWNGAGALTTETFTALSATVTQPPPALTSSSTPPETSPTQSTESSPEPTTSTLAQSSSPAVTSSTLSTPPSPSVTSGPESPPVTEETSSMASEFTTQTSSIGKSPAETSSSPNPTSSTEVSNQPLLTSPSTSATTLPTTSSASASASAIIIGTSTAPIITPTTGVTTGALTLTQTIYYNINSVNPEGGLPHGTGTYVCDSMGCTLASATGSGAGGSGGDGTSASASTASSTGDGAAKVHMIDVTLVGIVALALATVLVLL